MVGQAQVLPGSRSGSTFMIRGLCLPCYDPSLPPLSAYSLTPISACGVGYQWSGVRPVAGQVVDLVGQEFASSVQARTPLAGRRVSLTDHRRRRAHLCDTLRLRRYRERLDAHATAHPAWFHRSQTGCRVALPPGTSSTVRVDQSAQDASQPGRKGGEFFTAPSQDAHRRYEALRAYFVEGLTAAQAARRFDDSVAAHPGGSSCPAPGSSTSPACPPSATPAWLVCCWPSPTWSPSTCRSWSGPPATLAPR